MSKQPIDCNTCEYCDSRYDDEYQCYVSTSKLGAVCVNGSEYKQSPIMQLYAIEKNEKAK